MGTPVPYTSDAVPFPPVLLDPGWPGQTPRAEQTHSRAVLAGSGFLDQRV